LRGAPVDEYGIARVLLGGWAGQRLRRRCRGTWRRRVGVRSKDVTPGRDAGKPQAGEARTGGGRTGSELFGDDLAIQM